jgi:hypothetical protein
VDSPSTRWNCATYLLHPIADFILVWTKVSTMSTSVPVRDLVIVMLYSRLAVPNIDRNIYEYLSKEYMKTN